MHYKSEGEKEMQRKYIWGLLALTLTVLVGREWMSIGKAAAEAKHAFMPDSVSYGPAPAFVEPGAQLAVLEGNPMGASGDYTIRLKLPAGYKIAPHWHPKRENVTVITGTLKFGMGDTFDESKMTGFPAGSFAFLDPDMHHYVKAEGETIVQVHGQSPVQFNYINPSDDPSKRK